MKREIEGFIFDLDGVITDTAEYHYLSWQKLADEEGIPFNREDNEQFRGVSRMECLEILLADREVPEEEKLKMAERKNKYYQEYLENIDQDSILPGAMEVINKVKEKGFKVAIASASKNTKIVVNNLGIADLFDTISDGYSVKKTKPAPDLFLHTAEKLEIEPQNCVVIEDAESGVEAALAAKMLAVGIGPKERVGKAHYRYDCVADIDLNELL